MGEPLCSVLLLPCCERSLCCRASYFLTLGTLRIIQGKVLVIIFSVKAVYIATLKSKGHFWKM